MTRDRGALCPTLPATTLCPAHSRRGTATRRLHPLLHLTATLVEYRHSRSKLEAFFTLRKTVRRDWLEEHLIPGEWHPVDGPRSEAERRALFAQYELLPLRPRSSQAQRAVCRHPATASGGTQVGRRCRAPEASQRSSRSERMLGGSVTSV